jgi:LAO/AO transport system kinase
MLKQVRHDGTLQGRSALAQAISIVQSNGRQREARELLDLMAMDDALGQINESFRVGICGSPGSGKSSLIEALGIHYIHLSDLNKLAVLACDPSFLESGGSLLGDCTRMPGLVAEERCFLRPTPTPTSSTSAVSVVSSAWDTLNLFSCIPPSP